MGFRIFYSQAQEGGWRTVWPYLQNLRELKVIQLKRRNILRAYLSLERAQKTGNWLTHSAPASADEAGSPLYLDPVKCRRVFAEARAGESEYARYFANHRTTAVFYEDLATRFPAEMRRLQQFLEVPDEPVRPGTHKMATQALSEAIENYAELKREFKDTQWAVLFED